MFFDHLINTIPSLRQLIDHEKSVGNQAHLFVPQS